jgi:hypothetical protein
MTMKRLLPLAVVVLTACSTVTEPPVAEAAPGAEAEHLERQRLDQRRRDFNAVLVRLDQAIDSYVQALANRGEIRADEQAQRLEKLLRDLVLDRGAQNYYKVQQGDVELKGNLPGDNFQRLVALAADGSRPEQQAIALTALGFSGRMDVMPKILQGAMLSDPFVVDHAVLGLAVLQSPDTKPGVLAAVVENDTHPEDGRVQAAWALYRIQEVLVDQSPIVELWTRYLTTERQRMPAGVLVSALRGLGLARDPAHADLVATFLKHPVPRVRMVAALALGRMNAQDHWQELLELLGNRETVQNVRLHARLALAALAGDRDYGYDVTAWKKVFERGQ